MPQLVMACVLLPGATSYNWTIRLELRGDFVPVTLISQCHTAKLQLVVVL